MMTIPFAFISTTLPDYFQWQEGNLITHKTTEADKFILVGSLKQARQELSWEMRA
jgi:hypothetical protein